MDSQPKNKGFDLIKKKILYTANVKSGAIINAIIKQPETIVRILIECQRWSGSICWFIDKHTAAITKRIKFLCG